ncbi:MAG: hypothetical protein J7M18_07025 [Candidatus Eremiobacteraeota bacterium]|nr:hypothetical protein [Candidatus Eremiobacteraeota bacterium]
MIRPVGFNMPHTAPSAPLKVYRPSPENLAKDAPKMKGYRQRMSDGRLRQKRSDTKLSTLERTYGDISARPGNTTLGELRKITGETGIKKIIKKLRKMEQVHIPEKTLYPQSPPKFISEID